MGYLEFEAAAYAYLNVERHFLLRVNAIIVLKSFFAGLRMTAWDIIDCVITWYGSTPADSARSG